MESVTGSVTIREDKVATLLLVDVVDRVDDLEEKMRKQFRMRWGTDANVNTGHVGDVALVSLIQVLAVPAAGKMDLGTKTSGTVRFGKTRSLRAGIGVVEASKTDAVGNRAVAYLVGSVSTVSHGLAVVRTSSAVAGQHLVSRREGDNIQVVIASVQVVDYSPAVRHVDERTVAIPIVELRGPVSALIGLDTTRGAVRSLQGVKCGRCVEVDGTRDGVRVTRDGVGINNGVNSAHLDSAAGQTPKGIRLGDEDCHDEASEHVHLDAVQVVESPSRRAKSE